MKKLKKIVYKTLVCYIVLMSLYFIKIGGNINMEELIQNIHFTNIWWAILAPLVLIIIDVLTGIMIAWRNDNFESGKMRTGLSKKFGELVYILVGILTKFALDTELMLYFAVGYICLMELSSLAENCDKLGVPMPQKLKEKLNNVKNDKEE